MENKFLIQNVAFNPEGIRTDNNSPYSFAEWKLRRPKFDERDIKAHYNRYLIEWFEENKRNIAVQSISLKQKYLFLLKQLQFFFSEEEKRNWYSKINTADDKELLLGIPYFSKKLRDICLYYIKLRKKIKSSKFKYNTTGTTTGIENAIYQKILEIFTEKTEDSFTSLGPSLPNIEDMRNNLTVSVEELYDDKVYLDHSTTVPVSSYYNLFDEATEQFYNSKGIVLSSSEWFFNCLNLPVTADSSEAIDSITENILEATDTKTYISFLEKFLSEKKDTISNFIPLTTQVFYEFNIVQGENVFYYPFGATGNVAGFEANFKPFPLSSLLINGFTAGETVETADTIYVTVGNETKASWLQFKKYQDTDSPMECFLEKDTKTSFVFPYPGYGLAGPELDWTGPGLATNQEYKFLSKEYKSLVDDLYWSANIFQDTSDSILLNNSNIVKSGATAEKNPNLADQIFIKPPGSNNSRAITQDAAGSWLYKFDATSLPVFSNSSNVYLWPYVSLNTEEEFPPYFQQQDFTYVCDEVKIKNLKVPHAIAGVDFSTADKIYKLRNHNDEISQAIECAWLSGRVSENENYIHADSSSFNALFEAGKSTRFIWNGPDTPINEIFKAPSHSKDCPFSLKKATINEPSKCSCKQIYYAPFGHPGDSFTDNNAHADCVVLDTENKGNNFDLGSWTSLSGFSIEEDKKNNEFVWYQTTESKGWGNGEWVTGNIPTSEDFILRKGKTYFYVRFDSGFSNEKYPDYVAFYEFKQPTAKGVWMQGKLLPNGVWSSGEKPSKMEFRAGDIVKYDRQTSTSFKLISSDQVRVFSMSTGKNAWVNFDYIAIGEDTPKIVAMWPNFIEKFDRLDPQYPSVTFSHVSAINYWEIELVGSIPLIKEQVLGNSNVSFLEFVNKRGKRFLQARSEDSASQVLTFTPTVTGLYKIRISAKMRSGSDLLFENIPLLTAVPATSSIRTTIDLNTPAPGFLIEQDLTGWSYNKNRYAPNAKGAKPYWAVLYTKKQPQNRFKGVQVWGYDDVSFYNDYLPKRIPEISQLTIGHGNVIEYKRKGNAINWKENLNFKKAVNTTTWCELSFNVLTSDNLVDFFGNKKKPELSVIALETPTDIMISNDIKGQSPEITYVAQNSFTWVSTVDVIQDPFYVQQSFTENSNKDNSLANRFYPTIATLPVLENLKTQKELGGFFLPQNLGASLLVNKNFDISLKKELNLGEVVISEDVTSHVGGLGFTKQSQDTIYNWKEDNEWMMEGPTSGKLAGAPKKFLTKQLQTFVPYEANKADTPVGLLNSTSKFSPWGGPEGETWTDNLNEPKSFTGVRNVSAWIEKQTLKQKDFVADSWATDIYGNQYGLYKAKQNFSFEERRNLGGELWVRTNNQTVLPGYQALSSLLAPFKGTAVYDELTGKGIKFFDCYYDTLLFETSSVVYIAEVRYNFDSQIFDFVYDNTKTMYLSSNYFWYDTNWFFSVSKKTTLLFTLSTQNSFVPTLWELDLSTKKFNKVFPTDLEKNNIINEIVKLSAENVHRGMLHYNEDLKTFLVTYNGKTNEQEIFVANFFIKRELNHVLEKIDIVTSKAGSLSSEEPPALLEEVTNVLNVSANNLFTHTISCYNNPTSYQLLNYQNQIELNASGVFSGMLSSVGIHHVNYVVSNNAGSVNYGLTIIAE